MMSRVTENRTIVVGYDGSPAARRAVDAALRFGAGARLIVVHADASVPMHPGFNWREAIDPHRSEHGRAVLDTLILGGNDSLADADWELRLVHGDVATALLDIARAEDAEVVVVGSHGHGVIGSLLGSVATRVVRDADRPVLVVPVS